MMLVFLVVVIAMIYGMIKINSNLVQRGVQIVDDVTNYLDTVIDAASETVGYSLKIDSSLGNLQFILDTTVNHTSTYELNGSQ